MNAPAFDKLLPTFVQAGVEFNLVGGVAGVVHGAARLTYDVDWSMPAHAKTMTG